ncbi:hypothetical protein BG015_005217, partial [Linnemannia schmuckeri]
MKNIYSALIAIASSISLVAASPAVKRADGNVQYIRADTGAINNISNPPNDVCLPIQGGA